MDTPQINRDTLPDSLFSDSAELHPPISRQEIDRLTAKLRNFLAGFRLAGEISRCLVGPRFCCFLLTFSDEHAAGQLQQLAKTLAMTLGAGEIEFISKLSGEKSLGILVPNREVPDLPLGLVINSEVWRSSQAEVPLALGFGLLGNPLIIDLAEAQHILVAGVTGMGKSVCINTLLLSLVKRFSPAQLKLVLVDPKRVEFSPYHDLPHLHCPVITNMMSAQTVFAEIAETVEKRQTELVRTGARNFNEYNRLAAQPWPRTVLAVEELYELFIRCPEWKTAQEKLFRIIRDGDAVGIHLIVETSRPSAELLGGEELGGNLTRIVFRVPQAEDSRLILGNPGAETLHGSGDFLLRQGEKIGRVQGAIASEKVIARVTGYLREQTTSDQQRFQKI